jgi:hypothetical protein
MIMANRPEGVRAPSNGPIGDQAKKSRETQIGGDAIMPNSRTSVWASTAATAPVPRQDAGHDHGGGAE